MSDYEAICQVLVRYATGIDSRDWDLFRSCFTEDCALDYGDLGRWNGVEAVTRFMRRSHSGPSLHRLSNMAVTVDGDTAHARTYVDAVVRGPGGRGGVHSLGYYDDELVRTPAGWRIARRTHTGVGLRLLGVLAVIPAWITRRLVKSGARMAAAGTSTTT